jgi:MFS family permease
MGVHIAILSTFLPVLAADASLGKPTMVFLALARLVKFAISGILGVVAGHVADRAGPRSVMLFSAMASLAATTLAPLATSAGGFLALYAIPAGVASALITGPAAAAVESWFSVGRIPFAVGIGAAGVCVGTATFPTIGGAFITHFGGEWRPAMRLLGVFAIVPMALAYFIVRRPGHERLLQEQRQQDRSHEATAECNSATAAQPTHFGEVWRRVRTLAFASLFFCQFSFAFAYFGNLHVSVAWPMSFGTERNTTSAANNSKTRQFDRAPAYASAPELSLDDTDTLLTWFGVTSAIGSLALGAAGAKINNRLVLGASFAVFGVSMLLQIPATRYWQLALLFAVLALSPRASLRVSRRLDDGARDGRGTLPWRVCALAHVLWRLLPRRHDRPRLLLRCAGAHERRELHAQLRAWRRAAARGCSRGRGDAERADRETGRAAGERRGAERV